jgi:Secretion system C-terminal sorting domain
MKKILPFLVVLITGFQSVSSQVSLTFINHDTLTPNLQDTSGVFCRTFYHSGRNKFYTVYAGRQANVLGPQQYFAWREYDALFNFTGLNGILSGFAPGVGVGDFAMTMVGTDYYHLADTANYSMKLSKYDENFNYIKSVIIPLDPSDGKADMLLNYANGKLIVGELHEATEFHPTFPMQNPTWTPSMHKWEYDLNLNPIAAPGYLSPTFSTWGGSCVFNNNKYYIVTQDSFPKTDLNAYEYDTNWNYIATYNLTTDGQWSQGVLWDGTYYYIAYHSGNKHNSGNITVGIYDVGWSLVYDTVITNYANYILNVSPPTGTLQENANRPYLTKVNNMLYVSYDVDRYVLDSFPSLYQFDENWQSHVMQFQINGVAGIDEQITQPKLHIYPNPTQGTLTFQTEESGRIEIYNSVGCLVLVESLMKTKNIVNIDYLSNGLYYLKFVTKTGHITSKVIKHE